MGLFDNLKHNQEEADFDIDLSSVPEKSIAKKHAAPKHIKRWKKEEIIKLVQLWPNHSIDEISKIINRSPSGIQNIAVEIRRAGVALERKGFKNGVSLKSIINDALIELKLK